MNEGKSNFLEVDERGGEREIETEMIEIDR